MYKFFAWSWVAFTSFDLIELAIDPSWKQLGVAITSILIVTLFFNIVTQEKIIKSQEKLIDELV